MGIAHQSNNVHISPFGTKSMQNYRRIYLPGGTFFLTLVTYNRTPLFSNSENIFCLRFALANVKSEMPLRIDGAVIMPDHIHFLWTLPPEDTNYSKRIGKLKVLFTKSIQDRENLPENISISRRKHRESNVWQRRFWEHAIRDENDFEMHLNYIHYNPVKHNIVSCPHLWEYSSFNKWVKKGAYTMDWCCVCDGKASRTPDFTKIADQVGE
jgi:putative transposase